MEHVNKPNFNDYLDGIDGDGLRSQAAWIFNDLKNTKNTMISALRKLSTLYSYNNRKSQQISSFEGKANQIKDSRDSWVESKTNEILQLERVIKEAYVAAIREKEQLVKIKQSALNRGELSSKNANAIDLYLGFINDMQGFFNNQKGLFEDGRLIELSYESEALAFEWEKFGQLIQSYGFALENDLLLFQLKNDQAIKMNEWNRYQNGKNLLENSYYTRLSKVQVEKQSATGEELVTLESIEAGLNANLTQIAAEYQDAYGQFSTWYTSIDLRRQSLEASMQAVKDELDLYVSQVAGTAVNNPEIFGMTPEEKRKMTILEKAQQIGHQFAGEYKTAYSNYLVHKYDGYQTEQEYQKCINFDNELLPEAIRDMSLISRTGDMIMMIGEAQGRKEAYSELCTNLLPAAFSKYIQESSSYANGKANADAHLILRDEKYTELMQKYEQLNNLDFLAGDYWSSYSSIMNEIANIENDYNTHYEAVYKWQHTTENTHIGRLNLLNNYINAIRTATAGLHNVIIDCVQFNIEDFNSFKSTIASSISQIGETEMKHKTKSDMLAAPTMSMLSGYYLTSAALPLDREEGSVLNWPIWTGL